MTSQQKRKVFNALFMVVFAVTLGFSVVNPFLPVYLNNIVGQGFMIALIFSGFSLAKLVFTPLMGRWSDAAGSRKPFIISGLIMHTVIAFFFFLLPEDITLIVIFRFLQGVATAMIRPVAQAFVGEISTKNHEGSSMATFDVSFYAALTIGPLIGGIIGEMASFRGVFFILLLFCLLALIIALFTVTDDKTPPPKQETNHRHGNHLRINPTLSGLYCLIFARSFGIVCIPIFLPVFMASRFHLSYLAIGVCIASGSMITALLLRPMGKLSDMLNRRMLVMAGGIMSGVITLMLPLAGNFWQLILLCMTIAFFSTLSLPATSAILVEEGRRFGLGYTMGVFHSVMNAGFFIWPLLGGLLMDTIGLESIFLAAGILSVAGSFLFAFLCPRTIQKEVFPQEPLKDKFSFICK